MKKKKYYPRNITFFVIKETFWKVVRIRNEEQQEEEAILPTSIF